MCLTLDYFDLVCHVPFQENAAAKEAAQSRPYDELRRSNSTGGEYSHLRARQQQYNSLHPSSQPQTPQRSASNAAYSNASQARATRMFPDDVINLTAPKFARPEQQQQPKDAYSQLRRPDTRDDASAYSHLHRQTVFQPPALEGDEFIEEKAVQRTKVNNAYVHTDVRTHTNAAYTDTTLADDISSDEDEGQPDPGYALPRAAADSSQVQQGMTELEVLERELQMTLDSFT